MTRDDILGLLARRAAAWQRLDAEALVADYADDAVVESPLAGGTTRGPDRGGFMGMPATGRRVTIPVVFLYEFKDGKIVRDRRVYDFTGVLVQVGTIKAKPA